MSQKDNSSRSKPQNSDPQNTEQPNRRRRGDELYSMLEEDEQDARQSEGGDEEIPEEELSGVDDPRASTWRKNVLTTYKKKAGGPRDTSTLLAKIPDGRATFEVGDRYKSVSIQEAMIMVVDKMFDSFQNFGYDFNRDAAGTELELNWIRPVLTREVSPQQPNGQAVFSGRLSTRRWTMIVKGTAQEVLAFILPADKLIGFNLSSTHYVPYFKLLPTSDGLDVRWKIGKTILTPELLQRVFQDLFVALIKHAKGDIRGTEKFDPKRLGISTGDTTDLGNPQEDIHKKYRDAFFEDMRAMQSTTGDHPAHTGPTEIKQGNADSTSEQRFAQSIGPNDPGATIPAAQPLYDPRKNTNLPAYNSTLPTQQSTNQNGWPQGQPDGWPGQQSAQQSSQQQVNQAPYDSPASNPSGPQGAPPAPYQQQNQPDYSAPSYHQGGSAPQPMPQPQDPAVAQQQQQQLQQQQGIQHLQQQMNQMRQSLPQGSRQDQLTPFPASLSMMICALDRELEIVAKAGSEAFAQKDLARADAALKFSGRLTEFRNMARELLDYYRRR